jgi:molecular chaperone GrpE
VSELPTVDLLTRLDDLLKEVRRQGRAAIAAQAAAEACLEAVHAQAARSKEEDDSAADPHGASEVAIRWLRALIPVADAIDRAVVQAAAIAARPPRSRFRFWPFGAPAPVDPQLRVLLEGLLVLQSQLQGALGELGVSIDRRVGWPIDPERQRVVEVRAPLLDEQPGTVVEVVRPGYGLGMTLVREAEVVAARETEGEER